MSVAETKQATKHLTFKLDDEVFALDISRVREVINSVSVTKIPRMPGFMRGIIDLRGGAVPVVDLRLMFGMTEAEASESGCIIIVEVLLEGNAIVLGALVDSVQEVFELENESIESAPKIGNKLNTEFIKGVGKRNGEFIIILDIDKVFSSDELSSVKDLNIE